MMTQLLVASLCLESKRRVVLSVFWFVGDICVGLSVIFVLVCRWYICVGISGVIWVGINQ